MGEVGNAALSAHWVPAYGAPKQGDSWHGGKTGVGNIAVSFVMPQTGISLSVGE